MIPSRAVFAVLFVALCGASIAVGRWLGQNTHHAAPDQPLVGGDARTLQDWHAVPPALQRFPIPGYAVDATFRRTMLKEVADWSFAKDMAHAAIAVHALRLYDHALGTVDFADKEFFERTLSLLVDDRRYREHGRRISILVDTPYGAGYRTRFGRLDDSPVTPTANMFEGMTHIDKVLSALGEISIGLDFKVVTDTDTEYPLAAVLEDSLQRFHLKRELEFTLSAYCDYLNQPSWTNFRGETYTVDDAVCALLERGPSSGPCLGTHRVYALAKFCVRSRRTPDFSRDETRRRAEAYLREVSRCLVAAQNEDGSWAGAWYRPLAPGEPAHPESDVVRYKNKIRVTGHMLEWMAIVPPDLRPPNENILRAARYLEARLRADARFLFQSELLPVTHAIRALLNLSSPVTLAVQASSAPVQAH